MRPRHESGPAASAAGGTRRRRHQPGLEPVSYTHLDVYKRQRLGRTPSTVTGGAEAGAVAGVDVDMVLRTDAGRVPGWLSGDPGNALSPCANTRAKLKTPYLNLWKLTDGNMQYPPGRARPFDPLPIAKQELSS